MGYVTKEMSAKAREIAVLDYVMQYESNNIKRVGSSYRLRDHDSLAVGDKGFFWHSRGIGGVTALDFLMKVRNYDFVSAVCHLIGERPLEKGERVNAFSVKPTHEKSAIPVYTAKQQSANIVFSEKVITTEYKQQTITLPRRNKDNYAVIAYLQNRGIDKTLIKDCINRGVLYESAVTHNAVFLGKDENEKIRFASMRGTVGDFKRDCDGSNKNYGFVIPPKNAVNGNSSAVAIFESPIDCLSYQTLCNRGDIPNFDGWRISLGGSCLNALLHFLQNHQEINHCIICTDNDESGNMAAKKITEVVKEISVVREIAIHTERSPPISGKDWNDSLLEILQSERKNIKSKGDIQI